MATNEETRLAVRAYVDYLRDLGVYDLYRRGEAPVARNAERAGAGNRAGACDGRKACNCGCFHAAADASTEAKPAPPPAALPIDDAPPIESFDFQEETRMPKPVSFDLLAPLPAERIAPAQKAEALQAIQDVIGDCTRCPLAYAGRRKIVFGDGDPNAELMFVGEGPGADEDASGMPFVGKAGQLLNNMITAMGLKREQVYIANIVKCRPPGNRTPEHVEATTCSPFLLARSMWCSRR